MKKKYKDVYYDVPDVKTIKELVIHGVGEGKDQPLFMYDNVNGTKDNPFITKTFNDVWHDINCLGTYMFAHGVKDCNVAIIGENSYEWIIAFFANLLGKIVSVPLDPKLPAEDLAVQLNEGECKAIFYSEYYAPTVEKIKEIGAPMDTYLYIPDFQKYIDEGEKLLADGYTEYKDVVVSPDDLATIVFTSGTTGRSKAVMLAERNFFTVMQMHVAMGDHMLDFKHRQLPEDKNDVLSNFAILPLFHLGTFICLFSWPFKGWALNLCSDLRNFYRDLGLMHSDSIAVAPVLMESIYKDVKRGRADKLNGLWNPCGSSAMFDSELLLGLVENGMYITQCYGMTETCGDGLVNYAQAEPHIRALGKPDGHCEYKLDETGEICIRGGCVMLGYYKDPEATAEIIDKDGWLHTGDLAREDEDGYYYMVGRKKNLIILGTGENVSPEELERKLNACPEVQECVIKEMGKRIGALICCAEEKQAEVRAFITGLNRTLPLYQRITAVEFSAEPLPRNAMGKLLRR